MEKSQREEKETEPVVFQEIRWPFVRLMLLGQREFFHLW